MDGLDGRGTQAQGDRCPGRGGPAADPVEELAAISAVTEGRQARRQRRQALLALLEQAEGEDQAEEHQVDQQPGADGLKPQDPNSDSGSIGRARACSTNAAPAAVATA